MTIAPENPASAPPPAEPATSEEPNRPDHQRPQRDEPLLSAHFGWLVQILGFVRKELVAIARQPRLVAILVVGPFLILALFAVGFDQQRTVLRAVFVGPEGSVYERSLEQFTDELEQYLIYDGYTSDLVAAERSLERGDVDIVVVFPADPAETVMSGERARITVLHDKIDPIQETTVDVSTQVAVQQLNARILEEAVGTAQQALIPFEQGLDDAMTLSEDLDRAVASGDEAEIERVLGELESTTGALSNVVDISASLTDELDASSDQLDGLDRLSTSTEELQSTVADLAGRSPGSLSDADVAGLRGMLDAVGEDGSMVTTLDPAVLVRPFSGETQSLERAGVSVADFFAPAAVALLLQHMVLTFAALGLVTDRARGLFEMFRVGPIGAGRVLVGKYTAQLIIGSMAAAILLVSIRLVIDVPMRGAIVWIALGTIGLLIASIGLGTLLSLVARSDTQAVQYALLVLLAGLFFGGFFLDIDAFRTPVRYLSWSLPVTYGTRIYRDVMLRGDSVAVADWLGLGITSAVFFGLAWLLLRRRLRVE